jgi:hypothetical protein
MQPFWAAAFQPRFICALLAIRTIVGKNLNALAVWRDDRFLFVGHSSMVHRKYDRAKGYFRRPAFLLGIFTTAKVVLELPWFSKIAVVRFVICATHASGASHGIGPALRAG